MLRRFRPSFEILERREVFSASPILTAAPTTTLAAGNDPAAIQRTVLPYIEQENLYKVGQYQQGIIAILIG